MAAIALALIPGCSKGASRRSVRADSTAQDKIRSVEPPLRPLDPRLSAARSALERKQYADALRLSEEARSKSAPTAAVSELQADLFRETEYLDREIDILKRWESEAPRDATPRLRLFYIYLDLGWRRYADQVSQEALKAEPANPRCQVARALFFYRSMEAGFEAGAKAP